LCDSPMNDDATNWERLRRGERVLLTRRHSYTHAHTLQRVDDVETRTRSLPVDTNTDLPHINLFPLFHRPRRRQTRALAARRPG
jgi:hypothetical protein